MPSKQKSLPPPSRGLGGRGGLTAAQEEALERTMQRLRDLELKVCCPFPTPFTPASTGAMSLLQCSPGPFQALPEGGCPLIYLMRSVLLCSSWHADWRWVAGGGAECRPNTRAVAAPLCGEWPAEAMQRVKALEEELSATRKVRALSQGVPLASLTAD